MLIIVAIFSSSASESLLSRFSTSWLIDITLLDNLELTLFSPESPDFVSPDIFSLIFEKNIFLLFLHIISHEALK